MPLPPPAEGLPLSFSSPSSTSWSSWSVLAYSLSFAGLSDGGVEVELDKKFMWLVWPQNTIDYCVVRRISSPLTVPSIGIPYSPVGGSKVLYFDPTLLAHPYKAQCSKILLKTGLFLLTPSNWRCMLMSPHRFNSAVISVTDQNKPAIFSLFTHLTKLALNQIWMYLRGWIDLCKSESFWLNAHIPCGRHRFTSNQIECTILSR